MTRRFFVVEYRVDIETLGFRPQNRRNLEGRRRFDIDFVCYLLLPGMTERRKWGLSGGHYFIATLFLKTFKNEILTLGLCA